MAIIAEHINACNAFRACRAREAICGAKWQLLASKCWVWPGNEDRVRISSRAVRPAKLEQLHAESNSEHS